MSEEFEVRNMPGLSNEPGSSGIWRIVRKSDGKAVTPEEAGLSVSPHESGMPWDALSEGTRAEMLANATSATNATNARFRPICTMNVASHEIVVFSPWWPGMPGESTDGTVCLAWVEMTDRLDGSGFVPEVRFALFAPETAGLAGITDFVRIIGGKTDVGVFGRDSATWPINIPTIRDIRSVLKFVNG